LLSQPFSGIPRNRSDLFLKSLVAESIFFRNSQKLIGSFFEILSWWVDLFSEFSEIDLIFFWNPQLLMRFSRKKSGSAAGDFQKSTSRDHRLL
jgi:hypothetical protein